MSFRLSTASKLLHRPHLITPQAAEYWAGRLRELDGRAFRRPSAFEALGRKLGFGKDRPVAWDDDDAGEAKPPPTRPVAYAPMWMGEPDKQLDWGWSIKDGVAMMEIAGPLVERGGWGWCDFIHGYDTISAAVDELDADSSAKGGIVRFDTPGGVVASGIYDLAVKLQSRGPDAKPIWALCEMACSAGYWIASQFDRVLAPQVGLVGSIGVVMVHENHAKALAEWGVEITSIEAPEGGFKTDGAWWKAMSEEGRAALQSDINELFAAFLSTVETGRGEKLTAEKARALGAQVFPAIHSDKARDALALGLIDGVMSEQAAFEAMKAEVNAIPAIPIPANAGAAADAPAQTQEELDMKTRARVAAVLAAKPDAKSDSDKLKEIREILDEEEETEAADEDGDGVEDEEEADEADAEDEEDETEASARAVKPSAASGAKRPNAKTVLAIMDLPEAKGREAQARKLAETPGMTADMAKGILAAGPKASRLVSQVTDPDLSGNGGKVLTKEQRDIEEGVALAQPKSASALQF